MTKSSVTSAISPSDRYSVIPKATATPSRALKLVVALIMFLLLGSCATPRFNRELVCRVSDAENKRYLELYSYEKKILAPTLHYPVESVVGYELVFNSGMVSGGKKLFPSEDVSSTLVGPGVCQGSKIIGKMVYVSPVGRINSNVDFAVSEDGGKHFELRGFYEHYYPPFLVDRDGMLFLWGGQWKMMNVEFGEDRHIAIAQQNSLNGKVPIIERRVESRDAGKTWTFASKLLRPDLLPPGIQILPGPVELVRDEEGVYWVKNAPIISSPPQRSWISLPQAHVLWQDDLAWIDAKKAPRQLPAITKPLTPAGGEGKSAPRLHFTRDTAAANAPGASSAVLPPVLTDAERNLITTDWVTTQTWRVSPHQRLVEQVAYLYSQLPALMRAGCLGPAACAEQTKPVLYESCPRQVNNCPAIPPALIRRITYSDSAGWALSAYAVPAPSQIPTGAILYTSPVYLYERASTRLVLDAASPQPTGAGAPP